MRALTRESGLVGVMIEGLRLDTGSPLGLLWAGLHYASSRDPAAREMIRQFVARG